MNTFLMLFRGGASPEMRQSPEAWQAHMEKWGQWLGGIAEQGKMLGAEPLSSTGKTVSGTRSIVTDGPFMEGKEMVGGYLIVKAGNWDEAVEISKGCPILLFESGSVEIREIQQM